MIYVILLLSLTFCTNLSDVITPKDQRFFNSNRISIQGSDKKSPLVYGLYSAIIPGAGEYALYRKSSSKVAKERALIFLGIEIASWISASSFQGKYESQVTEYRAYADSDIG